MTDAPSGDESVDEDGLSPMKWLLFRGARMVVAGIVLALVWALTVLLIELNVLEVGPPSSMPSLLSGVVAGQLTLITVTLSINQLILSRMFATPAEITQRLEGTVEFRQTVREAAGGSTPPVDPRAFFTSVARELRASSEELGRSADTADSVPRAEIEEGAASLREYARIVERIVEDDRAEVLYIVSALPHERQVQSAVVVERLRSEVGPLPESARSALEDVSTLLEAITVARQHFKTLAIQQQLSRLSRYIVYTGIPSILAAMLLTLAYTSSGGLKIPESLVRPIAALSVPVFLAPSVVLSTYVLPLAVVAERTVATGPFDAPA